MADSADLDSLRRRLLRFFRSRRVADADDLASESVFRVIQSASNGACIRQFDAYADGVARNVLLEDRRRRSREFALAESVEMAPLHPGKSSERELHCLEECLRHSLTRQESNLIKAYYGVRGKDADMSRSTLASRLGVSDNALRIRALRIRRKLLESMRRSLCEGSPRNERSG